MLRPFVFTFCVLAVTAAVTGEGLEGCSPINVPSAAPRPPAVTPASLTFLGAGTALAQSVNVSETNYSGAFSVTSANCSAIAAADKPSSSGAFSITPLGAGSCTFTFTDAQQRTATLSVSVTVTLGGGE